MVHFLLENYNGCSEEIESETERWIDSVVLFYWNSNVFHFLVPAVTYVSDVLQYGSIRGKISTRL